RLDDLDLLELHANNRVRLKVSTSPKWLPKGPLIIKYGHATRRQFMESRFEGELEMQDFHTGTLSEESFILFKRKLQNLFNEFDESAQLDKNLERAKVSTFWLYAGIRPWDPIGILKRVEK